MRFFTLLAFFVSLIVGVLLSQPKIPEEKLEALWNSFKSNFEKSYNGPEEAARKAKFENNLIDICLHNLENDLGENSFRLGLNQFSDLDEKEFQDRYTGLLPPK